MNSACRKAADPDCGVTIRCSLSPWTRLSLCRFLRMSFFYSCPGISPQRRQAHIFAQSYPIRTVIQFSICPSIGRQREGSFINPLNNQLGTFLPFARKNFCKFFVNGIYNGKKSRYTAHQISGEKSLALSLMKLCTGSEIQLWLSNESI